MTDREWIEDLLIKRLGEIGKTDQGYNRVAFSDEDWEGRMLLWREMEKIGLQVRMDAAGNLIGRMEGTNPAAPAVVSGSHSDTVPSGGTYDGSVGIVSALCALRRIQQKGPIKRPIEIWIFSGHESSRFGFNHLGSKSICGLAAPEEWAKRMDIYGQTVEEVLKTRNLDIHKVADARRNPDELYAFIELHIEQGPILEKKNIEIGIVTDLAAPIRFLVKITGITAHSGTTPMDMRSDALVVAAKTVLSVRECCSRKMEQGIVGTVGRINVKPGVINCVPGYAELWVDVRGRDLGLLKDTVKEIGQTIEAIASEEQVKTEIELISEAQPVHLDNHLATVIEQSAQKKGISHIRMVGGGGHDAGNLAGIVPTAIIHIPCKNGVSHAPEEYCSIEDMLPGIDVLTDVMWQLANE